MKLYCAVIKTLIIVVQFFVLSICFEQSAYLDPQQITQGDTVALVVEYEGGAIAPEALDTTALESDFEIISNSSNIKIQQQGSNVVTRMRWELELMPLRSGDLEIPPLELKGKYTPKLKLNVKKRATGIANNPISSQKVFIQVSAVPENPYIGQQTNIIVKLYHNTRIINGTLSEPQAANTDVYRIGNDISYSQTVKGMRYEVLERSFALFPSSTGEARIEPIVFRGQIESQLQGSSSFGSFLRDVKQVKRLSNELTLQVKDIPTSYTGKYWLPANDLRISDQWSDQALQFKVGDSINRTIKIIADGLPAEALPKDIMDSGNNTISIYPDKVSRSNQDIGKKLIGKLEQKFALILSAAGDFQIPEVEIKWWDVDEDVEKKAVLTALNFVVTGYPDRQTDSDISNLQSVIDQSVVVSDFNPTPKHYWQWLAITFFVLWLITLFLWLKSRPEKSLSMNLEPGAATWNRKSLQHACQSNDPVKVRNELIAWAKQKWPENSITGLNQLKQNVLHADFRMELGKLDASLFSEKKPNWVGENLWRTFLVEQSNKVDNLTDDKQGLPPLYAS